MGERTKKRMMNLLFELLKNSKRSDRELAKVLGVSQPTVTRMRQRLVKTRMIRQFTVIPDLPKMGYEVATFTFVRTKYGPEFDIQELRKGAMDWTMKHPNIVFATGGEGMGMNAIIVSVHRDYSDYYQFIVEVRQHWAAILLDIQSFLISLKNVEAVAKPFSLKYLEELQERT